MIDAVVALEDCQMSHGSWQMDAATLVTYPKPSGVSASPLYQVDVSQGTTMQSSFVYYSVPQRGEPMIGKSRSWTTFSFGGTVTVKVSKLTGSFHNAVIRPMASGATILDQTANTLVFEISNTNSKLSVEFDADWNTDSLLIFADELERDIPPMFANGVQYFNVGMHQTNQVLTSDTVVYVAGGAYIVAAGKKDSIFATGVTSASLKNITIRGRGIISGEASFRHSGNQPFPITLCGSYHSIEGVTVIDAAEQSHLQINAPWYCDSEWKGTAIGARIHNVKVMGWNFADGIYSGKQSHVSNVFTKVNDDGVKPFEGDTLYENNLHWQQGNGWAIMLSWLSEGQQNNITVRNSVVIHDDHDSDWSVSGCDPCRNNQASIGIVHGGSGRVSDVLIENVVIESPVWRPIWIGVEKSTWGTSGQGVLDGITLRNVQVLMPALKDSEIVDFSSSTVQVSNIKFEGFQYGGIVA